MRNVFFNIREPSPGNKNTHYFCLLLCIVLGVLMGIVAKYFDNTPIIGEVGTNFGIWIFFAALISCYSFGPLLAGVNVFFFLLSMLFAYYAYTYFFDHFLPIAYIRLWLCLNVIGFFSAIITWYGKGTGWLPAFISSVPILFLITEGMPFFYTGRLALLFDFVFIIVAYICFARSWTQKMKIFCCNLIEVFILILFNIINIF
ncbi:MAG: hypothetical protein ABF969_05705 [Sporolactobacillus sp.]